MNFICILLVFVQYSTCSSCFGIGLVIRAIVLMTSNYLKAICCKTVVVQPSDTVFTELTPSHRKNGCGTKSTLWYCRKAHSSLLLVVSGLNSNTLGFGDAKCYILRHAIFETFSSLNLK